MRQILIRDICEQDISYIASIDAMAFSTPWSENLFLNEIRRPSSIARIAVLGDMPAGYIFAEQMFDEGQIFRLAVHPDYRKMKVATMLLENIIEELRSRFCRSVHLEVRDSDHAAQRLYRNFGFKTRGTRKGYYTAPREDAVIMLLEI